MTVGRAGWAGAVALLGIGLLGTGCTNTVAGVSTHAGQPGANALTPEQVLPDGEEVKAAVGNDLPPHSPPMVGDIGVLPNGIRDNSAAAPIECLGAIAPAMRISYEVAPVRAAALQDYWNYDSGVVASSATVAAIKLASSDDAQRLFASFTQQWRQCEGRTVTMYTHDRSDTELYSKVTEVRTDGPILSATIISWDNHHTPQSPVERAVGVQGDVLADAKVALRPHSQPGTRAIELVKVMLRKVSSTN
ncbi:MULTISPECIES: sensor domain-containing protein [Mycobacterium ulcerans group]|uniref:Lipoprotein n=4 Tax=Mycobacterium ulcerans TaxID=1809 RepID=A0A1B4Y607_MYCUL|nr:MULTISPECIES: sensor domain-containing protein [Mycobacterium ulcerans group]EUA87581.1 pknH-like extracellular domain protein [Mycobacterium ulcerans str. Harvey]ABL05795.1 conserved hypothetical lipoprotein, LppR_1 [Mycobacterium ulcerans Agy99]EPQ77487.1 putative lipoprotein [Mycobacterium marinum MB2]MDC8984190.1 sensor domain-containing protein [Mycobacterium marinum]MDC9001243.1 sensor domain-containing protein [Mycobacterium marinum]